MTFSLGGELNKKQIRCDDDGLIMSEILEQRALKITSLADEWASSDQGKKITFLNIRSLSKHFVDIQKDSILLKSDILCLAETWLTKDSTQNFELFGYHLNLASEGRGKGLAVYSKIPSFSQTDTALSSIQVMKLELEDLDVITVYRSSGPNLQHLTDKIQLLLASTRKKKVVVVGDFNFSAGQNNCFTQAMISNGFTQIVTDPTHTEGRTIDHCYTRDIPSVTHFLHPLYYSDHSALCISIP
jgi:hypothetical protein